MAVTVTDNRTVVDGADATTGWSSPVSSEAITLFTSDPNPVEDSGCLGIAVSTQHSEILHTETASNQSDALIYVWVLANGTMDTLANGGVELVLGDGTNTIGYRVAGSDVAGFRHSDGPVGWQCLVVDTSSKPATNTAHRGAEASLDEANMTEYGAAFKTLSKALGGASNCFIDMIRRDTGQQGISVTGGTSGDPGTFAEIAADDRASTSGKAYGIIRELGVGLFGVQGSISIGNTGAHWFESKNETVVWEDRGLDVDKYRFRLVADGTGISHFQLGDLSGEDDGIDGCALVVPAGVGGTIDLSDADFDEVEVYATLFQGWDQSFLLSADATNGVNHVYYNCRFLGNAEIDIGRVDVRNSIISTGVPGAGEAAILLTNNLNNLWGDCDFFSTGTGHAIRHTPTGAGPHTLTLDELTYSGYAATDGSTGNEVFLYDPATTSADLTITITGDGDTPTIMLAAGVTGTVTVVNNKTVTFTGLRDNTEVRVYDSGDGTEIAGTEEATAGSPDDRSFAFADLGGNVVDYVIHHFDPDGPDYKTIRVNGFTIPTVNTEIPVQQILDLNSVD